ncbi:MAG: putative secreted protein [Candidatus Phytoplasma cynodontis]|nr:MAG: putative secreted protein [Candidatus Phytoplasma cynodontis]
MKEKKRGFKKLKLNKIKILTFIFTIFYCCILLYFFILSIDEYFYSVLANFDCILLRLLILIFVSFISPFIFNIFLKKFIKKSKLIIIENIYFKSTFIFVFLLFLLKYLDFY